MSRKRGNNKFRVYREIQQNVVGFCALCTHKNSQFVQCVTHKQDFVFINFGQSNLLLLSFLDIEGDNKNHSKMGINYKIGGVNYKMSVAQQFQKYL